MGIGLQQLKPTYIMSYTTDYMIWIQVLNDDFTEGRGSVVLVFEDLIAKKVTLKHWNEGAERICVPIDTWDSGYGDEFVTLLDVESGRIYTHWSSDWDIVLSEDSVVSQDISNLANSYRQLKSEIEQRENDMQEILESIRSIKIK